MGFPVATKEDKAQIPSTKSQTNSKLQTQMTKTEDGEDKTNHEDAKTPRSPERPWDFGPWPRPENFSKGESFASLSYEEEGGRFVGPAGQGGLRGRAARGVT